MVADNINRLSHDKTPYVIYRQEHEVCGVKALENLTGNCMNIIKKLFGLLYKVYIILRERFFLIPPPETHPPQPSSFMGEGMGEDEFQPSPFSTSGSEEVLEEERRGDFEIPPLLEGQRISLCETLDRVLNTGVVVHGDITISVANIDLIYIGLRALLTSVETARQSGINPLSQYPNPNKSEESLNGNLRF